MVAMRNGIRKTFVSCMMNRVKGRSSLVWTDFGRLDRFASMLINKKNVQFLGSWLAIYVFFNLPQSGHRHLPPLVSLSIFLSGIDAGRS